ncbi:hypothetical protein LTR64_008607 [Lithohypha guttulata]|uniref:uncharacterized protein n=1 Tax=Lithohypha guttulata TaxID=1690604 RepID=UPI002DE1BAEA|nr:hypothetical protein LTR51_008785 [Lithohypha guttulata]
MDEHIKVIRASIIDGAAVTPRYRERQLASLHEALLASRAVLSKLLVDEASLSMDEAVAQFLLTTKAIKTYHLSVNPKHCLEAEYRLANGKDNSTRRIPYGCAYIIPSSRDQLYSTLVPVAAAIAAGNCVVVELQQRMMKLGPFLKELLLGALSHQTFAAVDKMPFDESFRSKHCIEVDGREDLNALTTTRRISTNSHRVSAVVDRSADIEHAAEECIKARFDFGCQSAYAPDVVLVNEFSVKAFCVAATESAVQHLASRVDGMVDSKQNPLLRGRSLAASLQKKLDHSSAEVLVSGRRGTVVLLKDRDSDLLSEKLNSPLLLIVPVSSMDDAINFLERDGTPLRASYFFCAPAAAKYMSQFISSAVSVVNRIPNELLIGPPGPSGHAISIQPRYTTDMFSIAQPEFIEVSELSKSLSVLVSQDSKSNEKRKAEEGLEVALDRVKEAMGPPIGFFEQGLLFGLGCVLISAITAGVFSVKHGGPLVLAKLRAR